MTFFRTRALTRTVGTASVAALAATAFAVPALAEDFPECDGLANSSRDWVDELSCASMESESEGAQTIDITADFTIAPEDAARSITSMAAPLTVRGNGHTVNGGGLPGSEFGFGAPSSLITLVPMSDYSEMDLTISEVTLENFEVAGAILNATSGHTVLDNVHVRDSGAFGFPIPILAGAVTAGGDVTVTDSSFTNNEGAQGGAITTLPYDAPEDEGALAGTISVTNTTFTGNRAVSGGAILATGPVDVTDSVLTDNQAWNGGAISASGASVTVTGSTLARNTADDFESAVLSAFGGELDPESDPEAEANTGGAIAAVGDVAITDSVLRDNSAEAGGAIVLGDDTYTYPFAFVSAELVADTGSLTVTNSTVRGNSAGIASAIVALRPATLTGTTVNEHGPDGSSVVWAADDLTIEDSTFKDNAPAYGGTVEAEGNVTISGSTFANNAGTSSVFVVNGADEAVSVTNSTFAHNTSDHGTFGALAVSSDSSDVAVAHTTFYANTNSYTGAAHLALEGALSATLTANVWDSAADSDSCAFVSGATATTAYNFDVDGTCTDGNAGDGDAGLAADPGLDALGDFGGATLTVALLETSPLIDAVPADVSPVAVDQRGVERPQGEANDIGAFEWEVAEVVDPGPETPDPDNPSSGGDGDGAGGAPSGPEAGLVTFQVKTAGGTVYGTADAVLSVTDLSFTAAADLSGVPAGTALPYGAVGFTAAVPAEGDTITITLTAPAPFTTAFKVDGGTWTEIPGATFSADRLTVTYSITDGGALDQDGAANGVIVDPVALATQATFTG